MKERIYEILRDIKYWIITDPIKRPRVDVIPEGRLSYRVYKSPHGPGPTVMLGHGCNGTDWVRDEPYVRMFNDMGMNAVIVDSWEPRGIRECCKGREPFYKPDQRRNEFYRVAKEVEASPWHSGKIGYVGFSHGGALALCIASDDQPYFAASVAYYPNCRPYMTPRRVMKIPLLMHQGDADTWTPREHGDDLTGPITRMVHPGAGHGFDVNKPGREKFGEWMEYKEDCDIAAKAATKKFLEEHLR